MPSWAINGVDLGPYLALNGVTPSPPALIGEERLALLGGCRHDATARKRAWNCRTKVLAQDVAEGLRRWVDGESDCWSFDADLYSAQGLGSSAATNAASRSTGLGPKYGAQYLFDNGTRLASAEWAGALPAGIPWTLMCWRLDGPFLTGEYRHWLVTSAGGNFVNGAASAVSACATVDGTGKLVVKGRDTQESLGTFATSHAYSVGNRIAVVVSGHVRIYQVTIAGTSGGSAPTWPTVFNTTVVSGTVTFRCDGLGGLELDDLVLFPFVVPSSWVAQLYAQHAASAWTAPELVLGGTQVSPSATVRGRYTGAKGQKTRLYGKAGETLEFVLEER